MDVVDRQRDRDDLRLVAPALGEQRADRTVDHARRQRALLAGAALALEERAGDLPGGVHPLLDVDRQREEVGVAQVARGRRREHHRVALADDDGAPCLLRDPSGLERDLAPGDLHGEPGDMRHCSCCVPSCPPLRSAALLFFPQNECRGMLPGQPLRSDRASGGPGEIVPSSSTSVGVTATPARIPPRVCARTNRAPARCGGRARSARGRARAPWRAPTGAGRRCAPGSSKSASWSSQKRPCAAAASAAQASGTARGCLAAIAKWRKTIRSAAPCRRSCASAQRGQVKSAVDHEQRRQCASPRTWSSAPTGGSGALRRSLGTSSTGGTGRAAAGCYAASSPSKIRFGARQLARRSAPDSST